MKINIYLCLFCWLSIVFLVKAELVNETDVSVKERAEEALFDKLKVPILHGPANFDYKVQWPYNVPQNERFNVSSTGVTFNFLVFSTDKPFQETSDTEPRTEIRILNDYKSGVHTFSGEVYIPKGTTGTTVFQVFGGDIASTGLQLRVDNGNLVRYNSEVVAKNIYDRWVKLKVQHDVSTHTIKIWTDGSTNPVLTTKDQGGTSWYFKCGVYQNKNPSYKQESKYKNMVVS